MTAVDRQSLAGRLAGLTPEQRAQLSKLVQKAAPEPIRTSPIPLVDRTSGLLPMSHAQRRLYFLQMLHPQSPAYNVVEAVRIDGRLNHDRLRRAVNAVVARHEVLRTRCASADTLALVDGAVVDVEVIAEERESVAEAFAVRADRPFDLERELPLRVTLAEFDAGSALLVVGHHIAFDAWSCRLLLRDLFAAYARTTEAAPPAIQYADYAAWQLSAEGAVDSVSDLVYWRERLAGMPPILELPLERPRPDVRSDAGAQYHVHLDARMRDRLRSRAADASVTPYALLLTAFAYVLHRHCATEDVVVGTPVAGRDRVEVEDVLGCFVNTVVLRLDLSDAPTRRALVQRIWDGTRRDLEHQALPFERLVAELNPDRDLAVGQLVQVLFNYYPASDVSDSVPGLRIDPFEVGRARAKFDLTCTVVDSPEGLRVTLTYATELVDRDLAARLSAHLVAVLTALLDDLDAPMATLPPVPPGDPAPRPVAKPGTAPSGGNSLAGCCGAVLARFHSWVRAVPSRTAVRCRDDAITYAELDARASHLAVRFAALPGDGPVALLFDRSIEMVVAMIAALKAGRTYVPLDPAMPAAHVESVVESARAHLVTWVDDGGGPFDRDQAPVPPDAAMYILFTSGSTGQPKGVVVEHRQFTAYLASLLDRLGLPDGLSYALVSTFAADLGLTNVFGALATGGTLHVLPYEWATDPDRFAAYFRAHRIDVMKLVPSHLQAIAEAGLLGDVVPHRHLVLAGEACPWGLVEAVRAVRPKCTVWNHYGPTETTVSVLAYRVPDDLPAGRGTTVPLGFPLDHVSVSIVDRQLRPVPRGAAGELLISGTSVARGYLSGERFGDSYRSGDRVRMRADGAIEFLGRTDRQVKIRGYRVEPSYVEAVLRKHPGVADVAVTVRRDGTGLVAYYIARGSGAADLLDFARAAMPPYLVPSAYVALDRLPLTPNGKLDWRALPEPDPGAARDRTPTPPRHARDERVAAIWCDVLGVPEVGIDDDFFALGGDSFAAMKVARRIGMGVRVVSMFQYPTVRRLVDFLDTSTDDARRYLYRLPGSGTSNTVVATIVAVPFGGGTAAAYADLARALPPEYPLYAVELPGHETGEPDCPLETFDTIASGCTEEISRTIRGPVVVYGHCVGAALAYEIGHRLRDRGVEVPGVVVGGAFPAPRLPGRLFDLWARVMPSDRWRADRLYRDTLRAAGGQTEALSLRALRHDARESEELYSRRCNGTGERNLSALCVVGQRDRITEFAAERHREWNLLCSDTELATIPDAGHYFLKHQASQLAAIIAAWTRRRLDAPGRVEPAPAPERNLRGFALVTLGQLVSMTGSRALAFALGIWVYLQTGSVTQFSAILVSALLPGLVALPFAGAAADRWNRRLLMVAGEVLNAAGTGLCLVAYATGTLQVWHVYLAASLGSVAVSFQQPAYLAAAAQLVPKQYLARTNGILQVVLAVSQAGGPLLGGALIVLTGLGGMMVVDLATVAIALVTLFAVRFPDLLFRRRDESIWREIAGGVRYIARRRSLRAMIAFFLGYNLVLGFALALIPPMVLSFASAGTLSLATVVGAVGGIAGGAAMALWGGFERRATGMVGFVALTGVGMIVAGLRPWPILPVVGLAAVMASIALINGHWQTMIQLKVGMELQGRVLATNRMTANLTEPLGYLGAGWLADAVFEPAADGGWLGGGPGRGMAFMVVVLGGVLVALAVAGLRWHTLHYMEDALPDAIPGAIVTWDRESLQRAADLRDLGNPRTSTGALTAKIGTG
jgi:amino acid adenylation domain-containing protein